MTTTLLNRLAMICVLGALLLVAVLAVDTLRGRAAQQAARVVPDLPAGLVAAPVRSAPTMASMPTVALPATATALPTALLTVTAPMTPTAIVTATAPMTTAISVTTTGVLTPTVPPTPATDLPPVSAIRIPVIDVARTIVPAMFDVTAGWDVPQYQVGHHDGSGQPGDGTNIVLNGHVGGSDPIFDHLIDLQVGDTIILYRGDTPYLYDVTEAARIQVVGVDPATVAVEAERWLAPTPGEAVTLITCWPPSGPNAFDQRLIVRALPRP